MRIASCHQQPLLTLEEPAHRHAQLEGRRAEPVAASAIEDVLRGARWIGSGSFCSVWSVQYFSIKNSPAHGLPVVRGQAPTSPLSTLERENREHPSSRN